MHLVGSTVAQPVPGAWLTQSLGITLRDGEERWPRLATELALTADRLRIDGAYADLGGNTLSVRLGRFRVPLGRANSGALGEDPLITHPLAIDLAFAGTLSATGGLITLSGHGMSLRGGLTDGANSFFGGGQIGILRGAWSAELPGGGLIELGTSGATNQIAGMGGVDASLAWHASDELGALIGAEALTGYGNWRTGAGPGAVGYGLAAVGWGPLEAAFRLDVGLPEAGAPVNTPQIQGMAVAYGMRIAPRAVLRLELSRRADPAPVYDGLSGDRVLAQVVFALGGPSPEDP